MQYQLDKTHAASAAGAAGLTRRSSCLCLRTVAAAVMCLSAFPLMAQQVAAAKDTNVFTLGTVQVYGKTETAAE